MLTEGNPKPMRFARLKGRDVVADFGVFGIAFANSWRI